MPSNHFGAASYSIRMPQNNRGENQYAVTLNCHQLVSAVRNTWGQAKKLYLLLVQLALRLWIIILKQEYICSMVETSENSEFMFSRGSGFISNRLTNSPLSLLCGRHIEDIFLVACVRFVVGLNVNGELLNKGTGVSDKHRKKQQDGVKQKRTTA